MKAVIAAALAILIIYLLATITGYAALQTYTGKITDNRGRQLPEGRLDITNNGVLAGKGGVTIHGYSFTIEPRENPVYTITYTNYQDGKPLFCTKIDTTLQIKDIKCEFTGRFPVITKALTKGETFYLS